MNVFRGWGVVILTAMALVIGLASYYYLRSNANRRAFTERNLRQLARMSRGIEARINNFESILSGVGRAAQNVAEPSGEAYQFVSEAEEYCTDADPSKLALCSVAASKILLIRPAPLAMIVQVESAQEGLTQAEETRSLRINTGSAEARLHYDRKIDAGDEWIDLDVDFGIDLDALLSPVLETEFFDHVFLADNADSVILQEGGTELRLEQVPAPVPPPADEPNAPERKLSRAEQVVIAGKTYEMFVQPIRVGLSAAPSPGESAGTDGGDGRSTGDGAGNDLVLGGLVAADRFRSESLALDPTEMAVLTLLISIAALGWPFIKLLAVGPRDALRRRDLLFLGFSLVMLSGLTALFAIDGVYYYDLRYQVKEQLAGINDQIRTRFSEEIRDGLIELAALTDCYDPDDRPETIGSVLLNRHQVPCQGDPPRGYPYFQSVFWTNASGVQQAKWATGPWATALVSVAHRDYVRRVVEDRLWSPLEVAGDEWPRKEDGYFIEPIRSVNTGEFLTAISMPCVPSAESGSGDRQQESAANRSAAAGRREATCRVAAMVTELTSLTRPVLPPSTGFAIIDDDGWVKYHSRPERALEENFFDETEQNARLRAAVVGNLRELVTARYLGRDVSIYTAPIGGGLPWTVAVFQDKNLVRTINFEPLLFCVGLFVAYAALLLVLVAALTLIDRETRLRWIWPDWRNPPKYLLLIASSILFAAEMVRQGIQYRPAPVVINTILLSLLAAGFDLVILARVDGSATPAAETNTDADHFGDVVEKKKWSRLRVWAFGWIALCLLGLFAVGVDNEPGMWIVPLSISGLVGSMAFGYAGISWPNRWSLPPIRPLFVSAVAIGILAISAVPAAVILRATYFEHVELLVRRGQLEIVERMKDRWAWLNNKYAATLAVVDPQGRASAASQGNAPSNAQGQRRGGSLHAGERVDLLQRGWLAGSFFDTCTEMTPARECVRGLVAGGEQRNGGGHQAGEGQPGGKAEASGAEQQLGSVQPGDDLQLLLWRYLPYLTEFSVETRGLFARSEWSILPAEGQGKALLFAPREDADGSARVVSRAPRAMAEFHWWMLLLGPLLVGVVLLLTELKAQRAYLVSLGFARPLTMREVAVPKPGEDSLLVVSSLWADRSALQQRDGVFSVDLRLLVDDCEGFSAPDLPPVRDQQTILVDHVERAFAGPAVTNAVLAWLEGLAYRDRRPLVLMSCRDLGAETLESLLGGADGKKVRQRWLALLRGFDKVETGPDPDLKRFHELLGRLRVEARGQRPANGTIAQRRWDKQAAEVFALLSQECRAAAALQRIALGLADHGDVVRLGPAGVLEAIGDAAEQEYRALWSCLSEADRMVASQLARGAIVSRDQRAALRRLTARGLIVRDPELRLFNESFAAYVRGRVSEDAQIAWEHGGERSLWRQLRQPLFLSLVVVAIFLFATQRELFNAGMAFVSATAVAIPALFRLLGAVQATSTPAAEKSGV